MAEPFKSSREKKTPPRVIRILADVTMAAALLLAASLMVWAIVEIWRVIF